MKKLGIVILALVFGLTLFVGQSFARGEKEHETSGSMGQQSGVTGQQSEMQSQQTSQAGQVNRASEFIGKTVKNQQGEELGELEDVLFDEQGNISYIVLSKGGVLGMGGELTPIPWQSANANIQEDSLMVSVEKQKLENAPTFSEWNNLNEQQFQQEVRGYYGQESGMGQDIEQRQMEQDIQRQEGTQFEEEQEQEQKRY